MLGNSKDLIRRLQSDPVWFVRNVLGEKPWAKQKQILEAVRDHHRVMIRSCHGAGKSWLAARVAIWWLVGHPGSIVLTTAPTFRQVRSVLWQEIARAVHGSKVPLGGDLLQTEWRMEPKWYAFGFSTDDVNAFQGIHAEHVLVIFDEAPGIPEGIWIGADAVLSSAHCRLLGIGNPTTAGDRFHQEFRYLPPSAKMAISAFDTPNFTACGITEEDIATGEWQKKIKGRQPYPGLVSPDWVAERYKRWGRNNPLYQSRVLGEFPETGEYNLIPLSWIEAAQKRSLPPEEPITLGVDVARYGGDETVIMKRCGSHARTVRAERNRDLTVTCGWVVRAYDHSIQDIRVDDIGLGGGVTDNLKAEDLPVAPFVASGSARDSKHFLNLRAESYWKLRERFRNGEIDIDPDDEDLAAQLSALQYKPNKKGQLQIESKEDMRKRGLPSPDRADALMLAFSECGISDWTMSDVLIGPELESLQAP